MKTLYVALIATVTLLSGDKKSMGNYSPNGNNAIANQKDDSHITNPIQDKVMEGAEDLLHNAVFFNRF